MSEIQQRDPERGVASAKAGFVRHAAAYTVVTAGLFVVNNLTYGGYQWWLWPAFGWGLGVAANFLTAFVTRPLLSRAGADDGQSAPAPARKPGLTVAGLVLGLAALGMTVFSASTIFSRGPASLVLSGRPAQIAESLGGKLRIGFAIPGLGGAWQQTEGEETVAGSQTALAVTNVSGRVTVTGWDQDTVRVRYVKQAKSAEDLEAFRIEIRGDGDSVTVKPLYESAGMTNRFGSVELDIAVPKRITKVSVRNVSGAIEVGALAGKADQELATVSGAIVTTAEGSLSANTTSGAIELDFSGDALEAASVSGRIGARVRSLGQGGAGLHTVSGAVEVRAYPGLDAVLDLRSVSGSISCDFPVAGLEQSRGKLKGTVGGGSAALTVKTTSGAIRIQKQ